MFEGLLPGDVATFSADPEAPFLPLFPEEEALVERAIDKRVREFSKGRECARKALGRLGLPQTAVLSGEHREPLWPEGAVGSITHTAGLCAAAVARSERHAGIGIDAEPDGALAPHIARRACSPDELARLERAAFLEPLVAAKVVFSAKESVYKLQFPLTRARLGFSDVAVELESDGAFTASFLAPAGEFRPGARLGGRWRRANGFIVTATWLAR